MFILNEKKKLLLFAFVVSSILSGGSLYATSIDFHPIQFKEGRPVSGDKLEDAVSDSKDYLPMLEQNASTLVRFPVFRVKVVGFTDSRECSEDACKALSLRRAQYIQDWLLRHGVPPIQLLNPEGRGSDTPVGNNATDDGRRRNRHAEIDVISINQ